MKLHVIIEVPQRYEKGMKDLNVIGYSDNDFAGDMEDRKSTFGQVLFLGGLPITLNSLK